MTSGYRRRDSDGAQVDGIDVTATTTFGGLTQPIGCYIVE